MAGELIRDQVAWAVECADESGDGIFSDECEVGFQGAASSGWAGFEAHMAYAVAGFNILAQWHGIEPDAQGRVQLSIAQFTLVTGKEPPSQ